MYIIHGGLYQFAIFETRMTGEIASKINPTLTKHNHRTSIIRLMHKGFLREPQAEIGGSSFKHAPRLTLMSCLPPVLRSTNFGLR